MTTDASILALLDASATLVVYDAETGGPSVPNNVYDGYVEVDETNKIVSVPLPYLVFYSSPGYDNDERLCGGVAGRVVEFQLTGIGESREQAKWVLEQGRIVLSRKRIGAGLIRRSDDNQPVRREDDFTQPGGEPLFYGVDKYAVAVS